MKYTITATEHDGLNTQTLVITLDVFKEDIDVMKACRAAANEFIQTKDGREVYRYNSECFNWGDFNECVPNDICEKYGFRKIDYDVANTDVIWDEQLIDEPEKSLLERLSEVKDLQFIDGAKDVPPIDQTGKTDFADYNWFVALTEDAASQAELILDDNYLCEDIEKGKVYCIEEWDENISVYTLDDCKSFAKEFFGLFEAYDN